jgi:hypothetical protein
MKIFGSKELETRDFGDSLQFVLTKNLGWVEIAIEVTLFGSILFLGWWRNSVILMGFAGLGILGIVINWIQGRETVLLVNERGIIARGNLDSWFDKELTLSAGEITSMGRSAGGEGDSGGVYVRHGYLHSWVLPGASEEQSRTVISAIEDRFPAFSVADRVASLLFGNDSGITTLNLSNPDSKE